MIFRIDMIFRARPLPVFKQQTNYIAAKRKCMRPSSLIYIVACAIAAVLPFLAAHSEQSSRAASVFYGWPDQFEGKTLTELPLTEGARL